MTNQLTVGTKVKHINEKRPYKVIAGYEGVYIATKKMFGKESYVVLDTNKNLCGHSELMNFPREIENAEDYQQELVNYANGEWNISTRNIGKLDEFWEIVNDMEDK